SGLNDDFTKGFFLSGSALGTSSTSSSSPSEGSCACEWTAVSALGWLSGLNNDVSGGGELMECHPPTGCPGSPRDRASTSFPPSRLAFEMFSGSSSRGFFRSLSVSAVRGLVGPTCDVCGALIDPNCDATTGLSRFVTAVSDWRD